MRRVSACLGLGWILVIWLAGCHHTSGGESQEMMQARSDMVRRLEAGGRVTNKRILGAMQAVLRQRLLPEEMQQYAYSDQVVAVDAQHGLAPPLASALAVQELNPQSKHKYLVIDPQTAYEVLLLARVCHKVTVVVKLQFEQDAIQAAITDAGAANVGVHTCDVAQGWSADAPYDGVLMPSFVGMVPSKVAEQISASAVVVQMNGADAPSIEVQKVVEHELVKDHSVAVTG